MKNVFKIFTLIIFIFFISCNKDDSAELYLQYEEIGILADDLNILINKHRKNNKLEILERHAYVDIYAQAHTNEMAKQKNINHNGFITRASNMTADPKILSKNVEENVGWKYNSAQEMLDDWLSSKNHRETIEGDFTHIGVSVKEDENGVLYYTALFVKI